MSLDWGEVVVGVCECCAAGAAGWCLPGSSLMSKAVTNAKAACSPRIETAANRRAAGPEGPVAPSSREARRLWALVMAGSAGVVAGALIGRRVTGRASPHPAVTTFAWLVAWAALTALLGLVDWEDRVVPTRLVRLAALTSVGMCGAACAQKADWAPLFWAAICGATAWVVFGAWAAAWPAKLGFGDARMASLVAFGAGAASPGGALVALACAPLAAAVAGRAWVAKRKQVAAAEVWPCWLSAATSLGGVDKRRDGEVSGGQSAAPLAPFLALAGIIVVAAHGA
jgi:hypothetical protein